MCVYRSLQVRQYMTCGVGFERQLSSPVFTQRSHKQCFLCKQMTVKVYVSLSSLNRDTSGCEPCPINLDRLVSLAIQHLVRLSNLNITSRFSMQLVSSFENDAFIEFESVLQRNIMIIEDHLSLDYDVITGERNIYKII